jgi:hypothetical protein
MQSQTELEQLLIQKNAMDKHAKTLSDQNEYLNSELDRFLLTDEQIRAQLDRKRRVQQLTEKNEAEISQTWHDVTSVRSRMAPNIDKALSPRSASIIEIGPGPSY